MKMNHGCRYKGVFLVILICATAAPLMAQDEVHEIWPGAAPGSEDWSHRERDTLLQVADGTLMRMLENVVVPTLTVYRPDPAISNGTAIIIAPGGAYLWLAWDHEGTRVANWLRELGVTAFILKYRLIRLPKNSEARNQVLDPIFSAIGGSFDDAVEVLDNARILAVADGRQAVTYVRQHAQAWNIQPNRIGMIGFSAGAGVTMGVATSESAESRPDFAIPVYGFHKWDAPPPPDAPPLFILHTQEDETVPVAESVEIFAQWTAAGRAAELHAFQRGPHGFGLNTLQLPVDQWQLLCEAWLKSQGYLTAQ